MTNAACILGIFGTASMIRKSTSLTSAESGAFRGRADCVLCYISCILSGASLM
jgi:hypothetical protein